MLTINEQIGKKIKELRIEKGLTQTEFANLFNLTQNAVTNIETGKRTLYYEELLSMANYFDVSTDYLIKENGVRDKKPEKQYICDYTGLDDNTIEKLHLYCTVDNALLEDTETDEMDKKYEIINTDENRAIINAFILSSVFDSLVNCDSTIKSINSDFMSYLAVLFGDYEYFYRLNPLVEKNNVVKDFKSLTERYEHESVHTALNDKVDLAIFKFQKSVLNRYEKLSLINKISAERRTFNLIRYAIYSAINETIENNGDTNLLQNKINAFIAKEKQNDIKKLKVIYEQLKKEV